VSRPSWYAGTYTGHVTVPSGDARVADATMTVVCRVIAKTRAAVRLTASVPTGFVEGYSIKVAGSLHTTSGKNMSGSVSIQRRMRDDALDSWDPVWTTIKTVKLSRGAYSTYVKAIAGCQIRVVYNGTSTYRWTASAAKLVRQRVVLNRPTIGLSLTYLARTSTYAIHGHCTPTHFDSYDMSGDGTTEYPSRVIRVQVQRYYRGAWRNEASADVTEADGTWAVSFTPNNTRKGRIRADHDRAYSAWKYFYIFH
jgi:hypothetical protein